MSYTPRPGSVAGRAVSHLAASGPMLRSELCAALGVASSDLKGHLNAPVRHGMVVREQVDGAEHFRLRAPSPAAATRAVGVLAWTAAQALATADLPWHKADSKPQYHARGLCDAVRAAVDATWRTRGEIARMTGAAQITVGRALAAMVEAGEAEMMPQRGMRPAQFRRVR